MFTDKETKQLEDLLEVKNISDKILKHYFVFNIKGNYIVPKEIKNLCNYYFSEELRREKDLVVITFYLEINGVVHIDKMIELVRETGINLTKTKLKKYIKEENYLFENDLIYIGELPKKLNIYEDKKDKEYCVVTLEELLLLKSEQREHSYKEKFIKLLSKYTTETDDLTTIIVNMIMVGYDYQEKIDKLLESQNIKLSDKDLKQLKDLIKDTYLNLPSWELNGFLPNEIISDMLNDEEVMKGEYVYAYMLINGAINIDTLIELLKKEHNLVLTRKELREIADRYSFNIIGNTMAIDGLDRKTIDYLLTIKDLFGVYKVIDDLQEFFKEDEENIDKIEKICKEYKLDKKIENDIVSVINFGKFDENILNEILNVNKVKLDNKQKRNLYHNLNSVVKKYGLMDVKWL